MRGREVHVVVVVCIADVSQVSRITIELYIGTINLIDEGSKRPHTNAPPRSWVWLSAHVVLPATLTCDFPKGTRAAPLLGGAR